jgi:cell migration-inducing and hyaluronan-binding protein
MNNRAADLDRNASFVWLARLGLGMIAAALLTVGARAQQTPPVACNGGDLRPQAILPPTPSNPEPQPDLLITGKCNVPLGKDKLYYFRNVNIYHGGELTFLERSQSPRTETHFWANSIIVEADSSLTATGVSGGTRYGPPEVFGTYGGTLTFHLYGKDEAKWNRATDLFDKQNAAPLCKSEPRPKRDGPCGIPLDMWTDNGKKEWDHASGVDRGNSLRDYFYQYGPLYGDAACTDGSAFTNGKCGTAAGKVGYFGKKVIAVSWGGSLVLNGYKGANYDGTYDSDPFNSVSSWMRLADGNDLEAGASSLYLERNPMSWGQGDEVVVTTTDYLPGHSEKLTLKNVSLDATKGLYKADFEGTTQWRHNGTRYGGPADVSGPPADRTANRWSRRLPERLRTNVNPDLVTRINPDLVQNGAETRAAVALLSRSIKIVSEGDAAGRYLKDEAADYSYGGHLVIRQGAVASRIIGVEFQQMGQGGRLGHYPIHFHMARKTADAIVKDTSINESMTRWIVLHSTQNVMLSRNVGYKSIGHGFYLEDGTETHNKFHSNIGIYARAAVATVDIATGRSVPNPQNPRMIPGILSDNQGSPDFRPDDVKNPGFPYRSDVEYPTVFWITNGWNDFVGNMAAGAGTCGAAFWLVPATNGDHIEVTDDDHVRKPMTWSGYAGLQATPKFAGSTPLKSFYKNYATTTMHSLQTTTDAPPCDGVLAFRDNDAERAKFANLRAVESNSPKPATKPNPDKPAFKKPDIENDHYYPHALEGLRLTTWCPASGESHDCSKVQVCSEGQFANCAVTMIDHYTSSFHWAQGNVSAIWLRPQWYLVTNLVLTDVQNGGLTFISGGDYTHSSMISGYWALVKSSVFVGNTNPNPDDGANQKYKYTGNAGPFNPVSKLTCDIKGTERPAYCLNAKEGISMPAGGFFSNQRLSSIYDGPSYQDSNAYLDITKTECPEWPDVTKQGCMYGSTNPVLRLKAKRGDGPSSCYLPNAAIGWKQPNGFYYPPAFHSANLFFNGVDLRHFVINPIFKPGTYITDGEESKKQYCTTNNSLFNSWTSIDRQTELTDDDGTLTGLTNTLAAPIKQTISVNEDSFFAAPVEAPECKSAIGTSSDPGNACVKPTPESTEPPPTARTSPYDYLSTVVWHPTVNFEWDSDCAHPACYGVPLYRQFLTPAEKTTWDAKNCNPSDRSKAVSPECRFPFIRMAGANFAQRQTMTMNNGKYYLDTTVPKDTQRNTETYSTEPPGDGRKLNVFKGGETYSVFFVYAKKSTRQTYQIYVGDKFKIADGFKTGRMNIQDSKLKFYPVGNMKGITTDPTIVNGVLTVNVDFSGLTELDPTPDNLCQPRSFCRPSSDRKSCESALDSNDPQRGESNAACRIWAVKDLDCPPLVLNGDAWQSGGCLGFSFKLGNTPADFTTGGNMRPNPEPFPELKTRFDVVSEDKAGKQCLYTASKPPVSEPCK